jgi:hypothetical protein
MLVHWFIYHTPLPCVNKYRCNMGREGIVGLRHKNTCRQVPLLVAKYLYWSFIK